MSTPFDITTTELLDGTYVEASAGTGKTFSIAALVVREIALRPELSISQILITTFTRNAAAELRDRVRRRIVDTAAALAAPATADEAEKDTLTAWLRHPDPAEHAARIQRLRRAASEFDTATISTIHSVCSRILSQAGLPSAAGDDDVERRVVAEKVNDFVVTEACSTDVARKGVVWDSSRLADAVRAALSAPDAGLWVSSDLVGDAAAAACAARDAVDGIVEAVRAEMRLTPTFDDLVRRAAEVVSATGTTHSEARRAVGERFRLVLIDEAQDTDPEQWKVFAGIVASAGLVAASAAMVVVGDPKQSIYRFRGADISSYQELKKPDRIATLATNWRSDPDLIDATNHLLAGTIYGTGIGYQQVAARPLPDDTPGTALVTGPAPLEIVDMHGVTNGRDLCAAATARVIELLRTATFSDRHGVTRRPRPSEVCVLVGSNSNGRMIEGRLRRAGVAAVSGGTGSVAEGETAAALRAVLRACASPSNPGRVRRASATMFLGGSLLGEALLGDERLEAESIVIHSLSRALRRSGVPAFAAELSRVATERGAMLASDRAERRMTDFRHLIELLDDGGGGAEPEDVLAALDGLQALDARSETVARRVESDADAVVIMTIHGAKGLEFPFVVVADLWKVQTRKSNKGPVVTALPDGAGRIVDVAWVLSGKHSPEAAHADKLADTEELSRRFYVAATRARHHLSVLRAPVLTSKPDTDANRSFLDDFLRVSALASPHPAVRSVASSARAPMPPESGARPDRRVAPFSGTIEQTYRRTSFSGITDEVDGRGSERERFRPPGSGHDETPVHFDIGDVRGPQERPAGADMPLAFVPAGADVGTALHAVFEEVDTSAPDLRTEIERCVDRHASGPLLRDWRHALIDGLEKAFLTNLGPALGGVRLADIPPSDRLAEMNFEMGLAPLGENVRVSVIGRTLLDLLSPDDLLRPYAAEIAGRAFDAVPLAGLINGSIDALLRVRVDGADRYFITDYKSNRLGGDSDEPHIASYAPGRLVEAMAEHHYPLQALIYGVAVHRFLRWRAPGLDSDEAIGGIAYFFLRGMVADSDFVVDGVPYGVFQWRAPHGLWAALSDAISGGRIR